MLVSMVTRCLKYRGVEGLFQGLLLFFVSEWREMSITVMRKDVVMIVKHRLWFHFAGLLIRSYYGRWRISLHKSISWGLKVVSAAPPRT